MADLVCRIKIEGVTEYLDALKELDELRARVGSDALREAAELRKAAGWPTPQPIETAPLGTLLAWRTKDPEEAEGCWLREYPNRNDTPETWRAALKQWGRTHWLPMPPPPGGGK